MCFYVCLNSLGLSAIYIQYISSQPSVMYMCGLILPLYDKQTVKVIYWRRFSLVTNFPSTCNLGYKHEMVVYLWQESYYHFISKRCLRDDAIGTVMKYQPDVSIQQNLMLVLMQFFVSRYFNLRVFCWFRCTILHIVWPLRSRGTFLCINTVLSTVF